MSGSWGQSMPNVAADEYGRRPCYATVTATWA